MSAYIVEDKTINSILAWLHNDALSTNGPTSGETQRQVEEIGFDTRNGDLAELGQAMFDLNVAAVNQRYGEGEAAKFRPLDYKFQPQVPPSIFQCLKSIECWQYQCSEGDVPRTTLYQTFRSVEKTLLRTIVERLPEYEQATWS